MKFTTSEPLMLEKNRGNDYIHSSDDKKSATSSSSTSNFNEDGTASDLQRSAHKEGTVDTHITKKHEDRFYYNSGQYRRYQFCGDCDFKSVRRSVLALHVKKQHPSSNSPLDPLLEKENSLPSVLLHCSHQCNYQTTSRINLKRHEIRHKKKSSFQCQFCSYSVKTARILSFHLKQDHPGNQAALIPSVRESSVLPIKEKFYFYGSINNRQKRKFKYCGDCNFRSTKRPRLVVHAETRHPESKTALAPSSRKWPPLTSPANIYSCSYCDHQTKLLANLKHHEKLHLKKSKFQCNLCSYSVSTRSHLNKHLNNVHSQWQKRDSEADGISIDVQADGNQTALLEPNPSSMAAAHTNIICKEDSAGSIIPEINKNDAAPAIRPIERKYDYEEVNQHVSQIREAKKAVHVGCPSTRETQMVQKNPISKVEKEISAMLSLLGFMKKKARLDDDNLKKFKLNKESCRKKIKETISKKRQAEIDLRSKQCEAIELKLSMLDDCQQTKDNNKNLASMEELIQKLESAVEGMDLELKTFRNEEADLSKEVEDVERSFCGIVRVLDVLKPELKFFQHIEDLESNPEKLF